jgi:hypothetical protein
MATIKLKIRVVEISNVLLNFDHIMVFRSTTRDGTYSEISAIGTRPTLQTDVVLYEFIDTGGDTTYWYKFSYINETTLLQSNLSDPMQGVGLQGQYCTLTEMREEGFSESVYSDARVIRSINIASKLLERYTGYWFEPRNITNMRVESKGDQVITIEDPIIQIDSIYTISGLGGSNFEKTEVDLDGVTIFNRHLTQNLRDPDDRLDPRFRYPRTNTDWDYSGIVGYYDSSWPKGKQIIEISGWFGYTELEDGASVGETTEGNQVPLSMGETPDLINEACRMLAARSLPTLADMASREDIRNRPFITSEKTREQSYTKSSLDSLGLVGAWTGNPEIDEIIAMYQKPGYVGAR